MDPDLYDSIGTNYRSVRQPDPRIAATLREAIGSALSVVNVGAGAGSYEPTDVATVAVEPSRVMIDQRPSDAAPAVQAAAEALPFADETFDVALALLTVHHWADAAAGIAEMRRVSRRQIVLTWDREVVARQVWFASDYLPESLEREADVMTLDEVLPLLGAEAAVVPVLVPNDCTDGFYAAYWARPEAYLDPVVRAGISAIALSEDIAVARAITRLRADLESGAWNERHGELLRLTQFDAGYRLVIAG